MTSWLVPTTRTLLDEADLFFRDFFDSNGFFQNIWTKPSITYPLDVHETEKGLEIDVAAINMEKKDIDIEVKEGNVLSISHKKNEELKEGYIYKGITNKSFNFAFKISNKFDVTKIDAILDKGLLKIIIPLSPEKEVKKIEVK